MKAVSLLFFSCLSLMLFGQANYNLTSVGTLSYNQDLNDIWGWQHSNGTEYALVGARNGTSLVSLATPSNPTQVQYIPGSPSVWRDLKTWGDYAYVTCDQGNDGLLIIDLSTLPNSVSHVFWRPELTINGVTDTLNTAHNLYIDENGYCYIAGSNVNNGEPFILDLNSNPWNPSLVGFTPPTYAHDVYARGDTLWTSDIYDGVFSGYDVTNKANPVYLGGQNTPDFFTHNAWISDDGNSLFTTDERADAYIGSYDVSDMNNVVELDRWHPFETEGTGVIPHNVHVLNDFIIISFYVDGMIVLDGSRPDNLVEVGRYDTYPIQGSGFQGCWGAYPYLPSGLILASDINTGLHVLQNGYQRACWLEGVVTDTFSGAPVFDTRVEILTTPVYENSALNGEYKTGFGVAGTYDVTFTKAGYFPKTVTVNLQNNNVTIENVELVPMTSFAFSGQVLDADNNSPIANAQVVISSPTYDFAVTTDAAGNFTIPAMFQDNYDIYAGKWGYQTKLATQIINQGTGSTTILLNAGYRDEFILDLGWTNTSTASSGDWARAVSEGITFGQFDATPDEDLPGDLGNMCYITGDQNNGSVGADDIDGGDVTLISPYFDLSTYNEPYLSYYAWFVNAGGNGNPNDSMVVTIYNGTSSAVLAVYDQTIAGWSPIQNFKVSDYISPSSNMWVEFLAFDRNGGHIVEAAVDLFEVVDSAATTTSTTLVAAKEAELKAFPNPSASSFQLELNGQQGTIQVFNALGQAVEQLTINDKRTFIEIGEQWPNGIYWIQLNDQHLKLIKQQ